MTAKPFILKIFVLLFFLSPLNALGEPDESSLYAPRLFETCECRTGKEVRRTYLFTRDRREQLLMVARCTECDLLARLPPESKQELLLRAIPDSASDIELRTYLSHLLDSFPEVMEDLLRNALYTASSGSLYDTHPQRYDLCFLSEMTVASHRDYVSGNESFEHVDCIGLPQVLHVGNPTGTYLLLVPVGPGKHRKSHVAFKYSVLDGSVKSEILKFEWYDPYEQKEYLRYSLDISGSHFEWENSSKVLTISIIDPVASCYNFSLRYSLPSQPDEQVLRLENSTWYYSCSLRSESGEHCRVPLFDASRAFKGKLIKDKVACRQPTAQPAQPSGWALSCPAT